MDKIPAYKKASAEEKKSRILLPAEELLRNQFSIDGFYKNFPFILFMSFLTILYIFMGNFGDRKDRQLKKLNKDVEELHWAIATERAKLLNKSNYTEVLKLSNEIGLANSITPPDIIIAGK